jgi:methyl-accepting chemotaxis protein
MSTRMGGARGRADDDESLARRWRTLARALVNMRVTVAQRDIIRLLLRDVQVITGFSSAALYLQVTAAPTLSLIADHGMAPEERARIITQILDEAAARTLLQPSFAVHPGKSYRLRPTQLPLVVPFTRSRPAIPSRGHDSWTPQDTLLLPLRTSLESPMTGLLFLDTPEDPRLINDNNQEIYLELAECLVAGLVMALENGRQHAEAEQRRHHVETGLTEIMRQVDQAQRGNFTVQIPMSNTTLDGIADQFNQMVARIGTTLAAVRRASHIVNTNASEVRSLTRETMDIAVRQAQQSMVMVEIIREIAAAIQEMAAQSIRASGVAVQARELSAEGRGAVEDAVAGMEGLRETTLQSSLKVKRLAENLQEIEAIVQKLSGFTVQMNYLALNATIAVSHVPDPTGGMMTMSQQLRALAMQSGDAAQQITERIRTIQTEASVMVVAISESTERVMAQSDRIFEAGTALQSIAEITEEIATYNEKINSAAQDEVNRTNAIAQNMDNFIAMSDAARDSVGRSTDAMSRLVELAKQLYQLIEQFTLPDDPTTTDEKFADENT